MDVFDVWLEALTAKQSLLFCIICKRLTERNIRYVLTARRYDYVISLLKKQNINFIPFGRYGGLTKEEKLEASIKRMYKLFNFFRKNPPRVHVSFTSPDSTRVAYGLGIPIILLTDSPHSKIVNRLTLPLANKIIVPKCTYEEFLKYRIKGETEIISFNGVFEIIWTKNFKPKKKILGKLKPYSYVILRLEETKASYYPMRKSPTYMDFIIDHLLDGGVKILLYPRYSDQKAHIQNKYKNFLNKLLVIPRYATDLQTLEYYSLMVITGGTSIAHEASLLGVPSITLFPYLLPVTRYIIQQGFPLFKPTSKEEILDLIQDILENNSSYRIKEEELTHLQDKMENPLNLILENIKMYIE